MSSWYFNKNLKPQGPFDHEEMKKKIMRGEIGPSDLIYNEENGEWRAAGECREFPTELFPAFQKNYFKNSSTTEKEWILLVFTHENPQGRQEGPYSVENVKTMLNAGAVSSEDYIWRSGLSGWVQIKDRAEFSNKATSPSL